MGGGEKPLSGSMAIQGQHLLGVIHQGDPVHPEQTGFTTGLIGPAGIGRAWHHQGNLARLRDRYGLLEVLLTPIETLPKLLLLKLVLLETRAGLSVNRRK
jgi:hypothetical protein